MDSPKKPLSKSSLRRLRRKNRKQATEPEEKLGSRSSSPADLKETEKLTDPSSSLADLSETEKLKALKSKSLYICTSVFAESSQRDRWVVHRIEMSDVLSESESEIRSLTSKPMFVDSDARKLTAHPGCGVFKSKIHIGGGGYWLNDKSREMFYFEIDTTEQKLGLKPFTPLSDRKRSPLLVEMQGELYAMTDSGVISSRHSHFERSDESSGKWISLSPTPFWDPAGLTSVITDTSILVSNKGILVFRFHITKSDAGWLVQNIRFPFEGTTLVQDCPDGGFIIFAMDMGYDLGNYKPDEDLYRYPNVFPSRFPRIRAYFMSKDYDSLTIVETLELPCTQMLPMVFRAPQSYSFLDLGD